MFGSNTTQSSSAQAGDLGVVVSDDSGRAVFKMASNELKVWELIGRSMIIHSTPNTDNETTQRSACVYTTLCCHCMYANTPCCLCVCSMLSSQFFVLCTGYIM